MTSSVFWKPDAEKARSQASANLLLDAGRSGTSDVVVPRGGRPLATGTGIVWNYTAPQIPRNRVRCEHAGREGVMPAAERPARDEKQLRALMRDVVQARLNVRNGRVLPESRLAREQQKRQREQLSGALDAYARAASAAGLPLPYRYRDEMRLYRTIYPLHESH